MLGSSRYRKRNITCCGTRNLGVLVGKARLGPKKEAGVGKSEQNGTPQPLPTRCDRRALLLRVEAVEQALEGRLPLGGDDVEPSRNHAWSTARPCLEGMARRWSPTGCGKAERMKASHYSLTKKITSAPRAARRRTGSSCRSRRPPPGRSSS
jgi:hypothetical protein